MSGKYQAYPEYKESSYGWLGSVPLDWTVSKTGRFFKIAMGQTILKEQLDENASWPVYSATEKDVFFGYIDQPQVRLAPGDLVIPARGNSIGAVKLVSCNSTTTQTTIYCKHLTRKVSPRYAYYYMLGLRDNLFWFTQTAIPQITVEEVSTNPIVVPSLGEQRTIAAFLDHETARIDRLIEKQQRLIELLKEKRQAVISHAVTKGLDPNVPMKDSGVEWLGQVPAHWDVNKFGYAIDYQEGPGILAKDFHEVGVPLLRIQNVKGEYVSSEFKTYLDPDLANSKWNHFKVKRGDLIISCSASTGLVSEVDEKTEGSIPYTGLIRLRPRSKSILRQFIRLIVQSDLFFEQIERLQTGATIQHYGPAHLQQMYIFLPSKTEQLSICEAVGTTARKLDHLIDKANQMIELMLERRTALISAAVTGKIDLRNWQPNTNSQIAESDPPMAAEQAAEAAPAHPCARGTGSSMNGVSR